MTCSGRLVRGSHPLHVVGLARTSCTTSPFGQARVVMVWRAGIRRSVAVETPGQSYLLCAKYALLHPYWIGTQPPQDECRGAICGP